MLFAPYVRVRVRIIYNNYWGTQQDSRGLSARNIPELAHRGYGVVFSIYIGDYIKYGFLFRVCETAAQTWLAFWGREISPRKRG